MMKIQNTNSHSKKILILAAGIGLITVAAFSLIILSGYSKHFLAKSSEEIENKANLDTKKSFIENTDSDGTSKNSEADAAEDNSSIEISARREKDDSVTVFTKLSSIPDGTCSLKITNGTATILKSAPVIYQDQFSTCAGFSISLSETNKLGAGVWSINVSITKKDTVASKTISYKLEDHR